MNDALEKVFQGPHFTLAKYVPDEYIIKTVGGIIGVVKNEFRPLSKRHFVVLQLPDRTAIVIPGSTEVEILYSTTELIFEKMQELTK